MKKCPHCSAELLDSALKCTACGLSIENPYLETDLLPADPQADTPTKLSNPSKRNNIAVTTGGSGARFVSETVLVGRYRIIGLIGKGGMGEVYKADDLELEQTVALKFLPESLSNNEELLRRFRGEVRNARQVSHRNVCRVFDIGETEGLYYITMEYIDGDDLSMLLRRIGRLPSDKAVEISRDICMGLSAIHKAGILHRDLKPANIIIDSKGEARITDFGIAGIEAEVQGHESRVGTPAYMSPEQIDGKEITQRSDIYSLGLLLYEIFTGKQAFEGDSLQELQIKQATTSPKPPSEIVTGIDPLVENVIKRCLQKDPGQRPESAFSVAMSLPGGDPLQIALDAGQTPSPEMVAASPKKGSLRPSVALLLLGVVFAAFGISYAGSRYVFLYRMVPMDKPVDVLRERARELAEKFGYTPVDTFTGFVQETGYIDHLKNNVNSPDRWRHLMAARPAVLQFWYRSSPKPIAPFSGALTTEADPPQVEPGMVRLRLDTKGRLVYFNGVPPRVDEAGVSPGEFDFSDVFKEAGLDPASFQTTEPQWTPPTAFDQRRAFSGDYPENSDITVRIEVAAYRGKLVSFEIIEPWSIPPGQVDARSEGSSAVVAGIIIFSIYFGVFFFSAWLAVRNIRGGRSDLRGSFRIMIFLFVVRMVVWAFNTHHVGSLDEVNNLITGIQGAMYLACFGGLIYLAFEPYMRRSAPERVISWNRLLAGDWRDPLVGRDILIGAAASSILTVVYLLFSQLIPRWLNQSPATPFLINDYLLGLGSFPGRFLDDLSAALLAAFIASFLVLFFGLLFRRKWLGVLAVWSIFAIFTVVQTIIIGSISFDGVYMLLFFTFVVLLTVRFGVLALISAWMFLNLQEIPFGTWFVGGFAAHIFTLLAFAVFGFYTSTAGQKLWQGKLLGDDN